LIAQSMDEMADHLCRLSDNKTQATLLGQAAREFIAANYTWPKCAKGLISYYNT
jgi:glycosyltransferase involved in cell wall biosynthesis